MATRLYVAQQMRVMYNGTLLCFLCLSISLHPSKKPHRDEEETTELVEMHKNQHHILYIKKNFLIAHIRFNEKVWFSTLCLFSAVKLCHVKKQCLLMQNNCMHISVGCKSERMMNMAFSLKFNKCRSPLQMSLLPLSVFTVFLYAAFYCACFLHCIMQPHAMNSKSLARLLKKKKINY